MLQTLFLLSVQSKTIMVVRKLHKLAGYEAPSPRKANFKIIIQGLRAELARPIKQAQAITHQILREIYDQVDLLDQTEVVCYTAAVFKKKQPCTR